MSARSIFRALALKGYAKSLTEAYADFKPYCDEPVRVERRASARDGLGRSVEVAFNVPCRKCEKCRQFRSLQWRDRCAIEIAIWPRTWFVTLTFSPVHLAGILAEAAVNGKGADRARDVEQAAYKHVQAYFKRLRKGGASFRYLAVYELGEQTGRSHFHVMFHEMRRGSLTKRVIEAQWRSNVHARLVGAEASAYVTKYATKSAGSPFRASFGYGTGGPSVRKLAKADKRR